MIKDLLWIIFFGVVFWGGKKFFIVGVDFVDYILEFSFGWILIQRLYYGIEFFGVYGFIVVFVKKIKSFFKF